MIDLPAELGWVSENLPLSPQLRLGLQGRFSLTHPSSAGRFIPDQPVLTEAGVSLSLGRVLDVGVVQEILKIIDMN